MNKEQMDGNWEQFKGKVRQAWGKLTDDDVALYKGNAQEFYGRLKEKQGIAREEAEKQMKQWEKDCNCSWTNDRAA